MAQGFDPGYTTSVYQSLVDDCPGDEVFPLDAFRVEWGPIFHRGRLDGTARVLVVGQDPATHESICRRILVGEAGQRVQGFLAKLGVTRSYVMINAFAYSVFGQRGGEAHVSDPRIVAYRNRWLDTLVAENGIEAIVTYGHLADTAYELWKSTPGGTAYNGIHVSALHPTYPEAASRSRQVTEAAAMDRLCRSWNAAPTGLHGVVVPDDARPLVLYGNAIEKADLAEIPAEDLPAGLPPWMRSLSSWASRPDRSADSDTKRATLTVSVPVDSRRWRAPTHDLA